MDQQAAFEHRGWSIQVHDNPEAFREVVERAIAEAPGYGITSLDLHGGVVPPSVDWISLFAEFRQVFALKKQDAFTYQGRELDLAKRTEHREQLRDICRQIHEAGLQVFIRYEILNGLPDELLAVEPTLSRWDGRRLWQIIGGMLDDFLGALPEVDGIIATADEILASSMHDQAGGASIEKLRAVYQCVYESCRRHRRKLMVREVGYTAGEKRVFFEAVRALPPDIIIMVKDTMGNWCHFDAPVNPTLYTLPGKAVLVECDLFGEHWGRQEIPTCRLRQIHRTVRSWLPLKVLGATGRIMVHDGPDPATHVFDTPNAANVAAYCKLVRDPGLRTENMEVWDVNGEAFDLRLWFDWLRDRYGEHASPHVVSALDRTPRVCRLVFYLGGAYFQESSYLPTAARFERLLWPTFLRQAKSLGMDVLRWEKEEALRLVRQSLRDIELARATLQTDDYENLILLFEQGRDVILTYRTLLRLCEGRLHPELMGTAIREAAELADRIQTVRGESFFGRLPERLRRLSQFLQDVTRGIPSELENEAPMVLESRQDEEQIDIADLGLPFA
jgi:hypothetical protein